jgi:hypothetical protein
MCGASRATITILAWPNRGRLSRPGVPMPEPTVEHESPVGLGPFHPARHRLGNPSDSGEMAPLGSG